MDANPPQKAKITLSAKARYQPAHDAPGRELCAGAVVEIAGQGDGDFTLCYVRQWDESLWIETSRLHPV